MMKLFALITAAMLALTGCHGAQRPIGDAVTPMLQLPPDEQSARQSLTFLVDSEAPAVYKQAAAELSARALALTGDYLTVTVLEVDSAAASFAAGEGQLALIDSRAAPGFSTDFATLSAPMIYRDYNNFTMGLNSRRMLEYIGDELSAARRAKPLAAFYQGGSVLVSAKHLSDVLAPDKPEADPAAEHAAPEEDAPAAPIPLALLRRSSAMAGLLDTCGLRTEVEPSAETRALAVQTGAAALAEFEYSELESVSFGEMAPNIVDKSHDMAMLWLIADEARYSSLPAGYQAALKEASAYMFPIIDGSILAREAETLARIREAGGTYERIFPELDKAAADLRQTEASTDYRKKYINDILQGMS